MPLDKIKAELIINMMRSQDVQKRLDAINKSREMFRDAFKDCKTDADWAFSAYCIETVYNLLKAELKEGIQERIGKMNANQAGNGIPIQKKEKAPKKEKQAPKVMDVASLMTAFAAFKATQEGG